MQSLNKLAQRMPDMPVQVLLGVSGGADSMALMYLLRLKGCSVHVVHVNHGLRGNASDGDEAFVRGVCAEQKIPLTVHRLHPPEHPGENWARQERYRCFRETAARQGIAVLALAHHRDDQTETLLLHLMRGAGLTGLTGMMEESALDGLRIIRPLLHFSRQELQQALRSDGLSWREDESNQDSRYFRNALRHELLPLMERLSPGSNARIAAAAETLQADEDALQSLTEAFLNQWGQDECLPLEPLLHQPRGLQRRILRLWWQQCVGKRDERSLSREQSETVLALLQGKACAQCNLPGGWHAYRGWTHLHLIMNGRQVPAVVLAEPAPEDCTVRYRRQGDWLQLPAGRKSLQDFFVDSKTDAPFRDRIPLLCRENQVLEVAGIWPADSRRRWQGNMPWQKTKDQTEQK